MFLPSERIKLAGRQVFKKRVTLDELKDESHSHVQSVLVKECLQARQSCLFQAFIRRYLRSSIRTDGGFLNWVAELVHWGLDIL